MLRTSLLSHSSHYSHIVTLRVPYMLIMWHVMKSNSPLHASMRVNLIYDIGIII